MKHHSFLVQITAMLLASVLSLSGAKTFGQCNTVQYAVSGGGSTCGRSEPVNIYLTYSSEVGVTYTLMLDGYPYNSKSGTGQVLIWSVTSTGTYTIVANKGGCTQQMTGRAVVTSSTTFDLKINKYGSGCSTNLVATGGTSWSWRYGSSTGSVIGTGSTFLAQQGGTYYLTAWNECGYSKATSIEVSIPSISISPSGPPINVCPGGLTLTASGGSNYRWKRPDGTTVVGMGLTVQAAGTYTLTGTNACGITETATIPVTVNSAAPAKPVFSSAPTVVCKGTATTAFKATSGSGTVAYSIANAGNSTINSGTGTVTWDPEFRGTATVTATATLCTSVSTSVQVSVNDIAQYAASGGGNVCGGSRTVPVHLTYSSQTGVSYGLMLDGSPVGTSKAGTGGVLTWDVSAAGTYTIVAKRGSCSQQMSGSAEVFSQTGFAPSIDVAGTGCSTTLTATEASSYAWRHNSPSGPVIGTSRTIAAQQGGTYYLTATNECGTAKQASRNVATVPSISISPSGPPINVCPGGLTLTASGGSNYSWRRPNGTTATGTSLTVQTAGTYALTGTNACGVTETATIPVTVNSAAPAKPVFSSAPTVVCKGTATTAFKAASGSGTVAYSIANAGNSTINSSSGTVTWDPEFRGTATVTATATLCTSVSTSVQASVNDITQYAASGGGNICGGSRTVPVHLTYSSQTGVSYGLMLDGSPVGAPKAGTGGVLTWDVSAAGTYTIVAKRGSCSQQMSGSAEVFSQTGFAPSIDVAGTGCSTTLTATEASSYAWRHNSPSGPVIGTSRTIAVQQGGTYYLTATNECGTAKQASRNVAAVPSISISPSGPPINVCPGGLTLTASGGSSYSWKRPDGTTATGTSLTVQTAGTYTLTGTNACGITETATIPVTLMDMATVPIVQDIKIAYNNMGATLTASGAGPNESYNWYSHEGTLLAQGNTFSTPPLSVSTTYQVSKYATNGAQCESGKVPLVVTVNQVPVVSTGPDRSMTLPQREAVLAGSASDPDGDQLTYHWTKQSGPDYSAAGEESSTLSLTGLKAGVYVFRLTVFDGFNTVSEEVTVTVNEPPNNHNYIETTTVLMPGQTDIGQVSNLSIGQKSVSTVYYDGLGRPMQEVGWQASPEEGDIVRPIVYDQFGRQTKNYLPFISSEQNGWYKPNGNLVDPETGLYIGEAADFYTTGPNNKIASDLRPFSETVFEASPLDRPLKDYGPGQDWYDKDRFVEHRYLTNVHGSGAGQERVIAWAINAQGMPVRNAPVTGHVEPGGYYATGQLYVKATMDEDGGTVREYTDKLGRTVLKKVQLADTLPVLNDREHWAQTYYIYDGFGNLHFVLQPELVRKVLQDDSYVPTQADLDHFAFQHRYDHRNRVVEKRVPGAGWLYMVYDRRDRLVLAQDGRQREEGLWAFTKYDALNRPVSTGIYPHAATDREAMQAVLDAFYAGAPANSYYEERGGPVHGYTNRSFPQVSDEDAYLTVTYYDGYGFKDMIGHAGYDYKNDELPGQETTENARVKGLVTGTKTRVLGTNQFLWSVTYYDKKYRPIQTAMGNYPDGLDRVTNIYNFPGWLMETKLSHQGEETATVRQSFEYDHAGRLLKTHHQVNNGDPVLLSRNEYNELGELVKKNLHKEGNVFAQSVDYRYNIRGWLKRINNSDLSPDTGDDRGDLFGMELFYEDGFEKPQYNGNISGARWKNGVDNMERAYGYTYDAMNRLMGADYVAGGTGDWTKEENRFEVGNIGYDHNGNILSLHRNGLFRHTMGEVPEYGITDQLSYYYKGNQLMAVNDAIDTPEETKNDFKDNGSKGALESPEYTYDANGNMIADGNKGITVDYNHLNLPKKVDFGNNKYIEYTYDAAGAKLQQKVHDGENPVKRTDYVGGMVYENGQLQFIQHEEGRAVMVDNDGLSKLPEYQYHLKDHLGNVRLTFSATPDIETETATLETVHEEEEYATFLRYAETTKINSTFFDHTGNGDTHYAVRLNGTEHERIGLAKSLAVMTGDTIKTEVYAKYLDPDQNNWTAALQNLMAAIAAGTAPIGTIIEAVPASGGDGFPFGGLLGAAKAGETGPQAYLNILVFDENLDTLDMAYAPVTAAAKENGSNSAHEKLALEIVVQQPGYVYIYLSNDNEQPLEVFFDDFTVEHSHSAIVQADDYYPFGLTFNGYRRENGMMNRYLYNGGSEWQDSFGLNWYSTMNRPYDPILGRFWGVDALSDLMPAISPMAYAYNNPLLFFDPLGLAGVPGCEECDGIPMDEIEITAPRLPQQDNFWFFHGLSNMSNPLYRNIGVQFEQENYDYLSHAFSQRALSYGEGLGYETEFMQGLNSIGEGLTTGLLYASFGAMAAPIVVYGSPLLIKSGAFSLSGGFSTGAILTRVGIEAGTQTIVNILQHGFTKDAVNNIDFADIFLAGLGMNYVGSSVIGASITINAKSGFSLQNNSRDFTRDLTVGLVSGGQHILLKKSQITPQLIEVFNGFNQIKAKGLGAASDYIKD